MEPMAPAGPAAPLLPVAAAARPRSPSSELRLRSPSQHAGALGKALQRARHDSSDLLETARRAAAAAETAAQVASASPPNIHKQMRAADALQEFCLAIIALAQQHGRVQDAEDAVIVLVGMLDARAPGVATSAAAALAAMMAARGESSSRAAAAVESSVVSSAGSSPLGQRAGPSLKATGYAALATVGRGIELAEVQSQRWVQQEAVRTAGGMPKLVKMMAAANVKERCASANALSNASDHNQANCDTIVDGGGLAILHTLLVHEPPENANAEETDEDKELKFWALATLGNLAASNDANRTAINKLDIIPLLVRMTTTAAKVTRESSTGTSGEKGEGKDLQLVAGEVLSSMLAKGDKSIEMAIVSGIVDTVRGEGSKPPESFPELMRSLQTAARERLAKVQAGSDEEALNLALDFGRWIKLPTVLLGTARNGFKARQIKALKEAQHLERRRDLGLAGKASPAGSPETSTMQLAVGTAPSAGARSARAHSAGAASEHEQQTLSHADTGRQGQKAGRQRRVPSESRQWPSLRAPAPIDDGDVMVNPARNYHRPWTRGSAATVPKAKPPDLVLAGAGIVSKPKPPRAGAALAAAPAPKPKVGAGATSTRAGAPSRQSSHRGAIASAPAPAAAAIHSSSSPFTALQVHPSWRRPSSESETSQRETSQRSTRASGDSGDSGDSGSSPPHKGDASQGSFRARDPFAGDALRDTALLAHPLAHRGRGRQPVRPQLALLQEERSRAPEADGCSRQTSSRGSGSHRSTSSRARKARRSTRDQLSDQSLDSKLFTLPEEGEMEDM